jgi:methyl coenzyme M reductase alpha subunit
VVRGRSGASAQERVEGILDAALLLAADGISGVSTRAVAREAHVSLGLVNYYYQDKRDASRALDLCWDEGSGLGRRSPAGDRRLPSLTPHESPARRVPAFRRV